MPEPPPGTVTIGVDVGTTGLKAVALDERARVVAEHAVRYPTRPAGTAAEQDAEVWWAAARTALSRVTAACGTRVTGVAVTGQAPTLVAVDRRGDPLGPALTWIEPARAALYAARFDVFQRLRETLPPLARPLLPPPPDLGDHQ